MPKPGMRSAIDWRCDLGLIRRLLAEQGAPNWRSYAIAFVLMGIAAGCTALTAYLMGRVVNELYLDRNFPGVLVLSVVTIGLFTTRGLATYAQTVVLARLSNRITMSNQKGLFRKMIRESVGYFSAAHSSAFIGRITFASGAAAGVLNLLITAMGRDGLVLIGLATVMILQDPLLSLIGLVVMPPAVLFVRNLVHRVRSLTGSHFAGGMEAAKTMQESLQGLRTVKAFTAEEQISRRFDENMDRIERTANELAQVSNRSGPLMEMLGGIAIALVFIYGGYRVIMTGATPGAFFSFVTAFLLAYEPAKRLARLNLDLSNGLVGVRTLFELIDSPPTEPADDHKPPLVIEAGRIEFREVVFGYRDDRTIIRNLSFTAEPGRVTALVGPSGGGKSTVFNLILRFYEPVQGAIVIDGRDLADVSRHSLRQQIAYVAQDVFLFDGSVRENIAFGRPGAEHDEIVEAAKAANAHDFIMRSPNGYDTPVGEHGLQLSGGERQRIAIARALLKNAPIILLDEATSSLDSESEREIRDAIARLCRGRTTVVIAHRLHTIVRADKICFLEDGGIVEAGRHDELLRADGRYAAFFQEQLRTGSSESDPVAASDLSFSADRANSKFRKPPLTGVPETLNAANES